jgi:hypothetical protein
MLTEEAEVQCWVKPDGQIEVLTKTWILRDGERLTASNHRHVVDVGQDVSGEDQLIQDVARDMHTPERVAKRNVARAANEALAEIAQPSGRPPE